MWLVAPLRAQSPSLASNVREDRIASAALHRTLPYRVVLPSGYDASSAARFPVLYLLHGYGGTFKNWTDLTSIAAIVAARHEIVVTPDGANSWYVNGANGEAWADYLTHDLVADVERKYRVRAERGARGVAGLSMGGYGAIVAGLEHADEYVFVGSVSGALDITREHDVFTTQSHVDVSPVFGAIASPVRRGNDVFVLAAAVTPAAPYIYQVEGSGDPWRAPNREFASVLDAHGARHEYHEAPGTHDWTFWGREVTGVLDAFERAVR